METSHRAMEQSAHEEPGQGPQSPPQSQVDASRGRDTVLWGLLIGFVLVLLAISVYRWAFVGTTEAPPVLGEVPELSLINRDGRGITREDLRGTPWIAGFIFTRCVAICPRMSAQMKGLVQHLGPGSPVRVVSITVDPEHDTPAVLDEYARRFEAPESWLFLTGDKQQIYELSLTGFKLAVGPADQGAVDPIIHSTRLVLVDSEGRIRGYYDAFDPAEIERLKLELDTLL